MATAKRKTAVKSVVPKKFKKLEQWTLNAKETEISRTFKTRDFVSGLSLVARIAVHAEILGHHPDIELTYTKVKVTLTTHDAGGLTDKDYELAMRIDELQR